jgi:hypothetical protein
VRGCVREAGGRQREGQKKKVRRRVGGRRLGRKERE